MAIRWSLLIGVLLSPSLVVTPVQSAFPGTNGIIIVDKGPRGHGDGHWGHELYTINPDGSNLTRLTHSESFVYNRQPTWSPNGQLIAYTEKSAADRYRIVVIDPKGNEVDATSSSNGLVGDPSWSPDGTNLIYARRGDIWVHELGGSQPDRQISSGKRQRFLPMWSSDGTKLAFVRYIRTDFRLAVADIDLSKQRALTDVTTITPSGREDWCPDWHPTENRIVVTRFAPSFKSNEIVVINTATGKGRRLTNDRSASDWCPAFSPDGKHVVWERTVFKRYGYGQADNKLVRMRLSTGHRTTVASKQRLSMPDWQPLNQVP